MKRSTIDWRRHNWSAWYPWAWELCYIRTILTWNHDHHHLLKDRDNFFHPLSAFEVFKASLFLLIYQLSYEFRIYEVQKFLRLLWSVMVWGMLWLRGSMRKELLCGVQKRMGSIAEICVTNNIILESWNPSFPDDTVIHTFWCKFTNCS